MIDKKGDTHWLRPRSTIIGQIFWIRAFFENLKFDSSNGLRQSNELSRTLGMCLNEVETGVVADHDQIFQNYREATFVVHFVLFHASR